MKNLKKFVALLLAGVMAMVMLTACSGGGTAADTKKEEAIREQLGKRTEATELCDDDGKVKNDRELYKIAEDFLDADIEASHGSAVFKGKIHSDGIDPAKEYVTFTVTMDYHYGVILTNLMTEISKAVGQVGGNVNVKLDNKWAGAAVVVKSNEKRTYMAVTIRIVNIAYNK
ncbi:hypothetical protein [Faecalibacterium sp. PGM34]